MLSGTGRLKVAIYVKEFSKKESELFPDRKAREMCKAFIQNQKQWRTVREYCDDYSKSNDLLQLKKLIVEGGEGQFDLVITSEAGRFGEDVGVAYQNAKKLLSLGIGTIFIADDINTRHSVGMLKLEIMAQMLESKKRLQSERVKEGLRKKRKKQEKEIDVNQL